MDFRPILNAVFFFALYPFKLVFGTIKGILNTILVFVARLLRLDKLVSKMSSWLIRRSDRFFAFHRNPLLRGDLLAYAEQEYPRDLYPTAWEDIPDDVRHELVWDGRLLNGRRVAELAKAKITDEVVGNALVRSGVHALALTFLITSIPLYIAAMDSGRGLAGIFGGHTPFPSWAWVNGAILPVAAWGLLTVIERIGNVLQIAVVSGLGLLAFPLFWLFAFAHAMNGAWDSASYSLRVATRDSEVFWKSNILGRRNQYLAYCREVENACHRLKDQPIIPVGQATGLIRGRGDMEAPDRGTIVCYDGESIRQHTLILGGTGSGKTRLVIKPLFKRIMEANWGVSHKIGAYVTDGKGTLWQALAKVVAHRDDIAILGTHEDHFGLDLCQGMTPLEISTTFKAVAGQINGEPKDSFWPESASLLLMHSATVARAIQMSGGVREKWRTTRRCMPYSLIGIAQIASNTTLMRECFAECAALARFLMDEDDVDDETTAIMTAADQSIEWLEGSHLSLGDHTKGSIIANVSSVLGKLSGAPDITARFCSGAFEKSVDVDHALKGGILFVAIGETEHGMAGKVVNCWLKTRLYILAKRRLLTDPEGCRNTSCALVADEFQMLATVGPDTDTTFWNIARETGVFMIAATQSVAALHQAIGHHATSNLMNLLRSKVILKTEERETLEYAKALAGEVARGWEYESSFYATQAIRQLEYNDNFAPQIEVGGFHGLGPQSFTASTEQYQPYDASHIGAMWERASHQVGGGGAGGSVDIGDGGASQNAQQMAMREEDQNRQSFIGTLQMRPKIDTDELLVGSGMAFAIIQRAGGDRMDVIDLEKIAA
ncbi:type IV secretory system conjugative DNA transfer family protein [Rhizobium phaseoli]|uniref:Type IV secretion system DNA-binding domain-containing protein n=1 Tax=Rhizobium phaseoli TaxID=396 RepID=A0ABN4QNB2_9HYPH|nr:type IV secretion system DNA-binding domain-containing protein [Rhizobium phaseoli]ANL87068.1 type IV secretion system DNA-binding domain-containing protein [Rhizobium phaseoli]ANL93577.1 type IV secretion system DNA-binding domain-containing protein [Rhizobium phaseoli]